MRRKNENSTKWEWENSSKDWHIELQLHKKHYQSGRFVSCIYYKEAFKLDVPKLIKKAFEKKSTKYGKLDHPFILAINVDTLSLEKEEEMDTLFGQEETMVTIDGKETLRRQKNGAWHGLNGPQNTRVSAAWIFDNLTPWRLNKRHILYLNPDADQTLNEDFYSSLPHAKAHNGKIIWIDGAPIFEILELNWNWLK